MDQKSLMAEQQFGQEFIHWYYTNFNENKEEIRNVYDESTLITFQDNQITGINRKGELNIMEKILSPSLIEMTKKPITITAQPSISGTVLICVQGNCRMSATEAEELGFFEIFLLAQTQGGGFQIVNQVFSTASV